MPDTGGVLLAVGIVSGLVATDLLLVMLVLAARVPFIDRAIGQDSAIAFHRRLGTPAMALLVAHLVFVVTGYAMIEPANPAAEAITLVAAGADLTAAYWAFALIVLVVVTSVVGAIRRRMPYEAWHLVHLLAYVGVLLAVPHELEQGDVLALGTPERLYWAGALRVRVRRPRALPRRPSRSEERAPRPSGDLGRARGAGRGVDPHGGQGPRDGCARPGDSTPPGGSGAGAPGGMRIRCPSRRCRPTPSRGSPFGRSGPERAVSPICGPAPSCPWPGRTACSPSGPERRRTSRSSRRGSGSPERDPCSRTPRCDRERRRWCSARATSGSGTSGRRSSIWCGSAEPPC